MFVQRFGIQRVAAQHVAGQQFWGLHSHSLLAIVAIGFCLLAESAWVRSAFAQQQPSGTTAVAAIEEALATAIARAEKSVVAISCVRKSDSEANSKLEIHADALNRLTLSQPPAQPGQ